MITDRLKDKLSDISSSMNPKTIAKAFAGSIGGAMSKIFTDNKAKQMAHSTALVKNKDIDPAFFTKISENVRIIIKKKDTIADIASKIHNYLKYTFDQKNMQLELDSTIHKINHEKERTRQQQLLEAINHATGHSDKVNVDIEKKKKTSSESTVVKLIEGAVLLAGVAAKKLAANVAKMSMVPKELITKIVKELGGLGIVTSIVAGTAALVSSESVLAAIGNAESGKTSYNATNKGTKDGQIIAGNKEDIVNMTIGEIERRQALPQGDPNRLFAVGKYQTIGPTLEAARKRLGISKDQKYDAETQDRIAQNIYMQIPEVIAYLNSDGSDLNLRTKAIEAISHVWAAVGAPSKGGNSYYGQGNRASISVEHMGELLNRDRIKLHDKLPEVSKPITATELTSVEPTFNGEQLEADSAQLNEKKKKSAYATAIDNTTTIFNQIKKELPVTLVGPRENERPAILEETINGIQ